MEETLRVGLPAPNFDLPVALPGGQRDRATLAGYRGRWLALLFYPRDFSMVCPTELTGTSARIADFSALGCEVLAVSVDSVEIHASWLRTPQADGGVAGLAFPLASDEKAVVMRRYGVFDEERGVGLRGLFLVDPNGILQCQTVLPLTVGRGTDETLRVLAALQTGGLCPLDWRQGATAVPLEDQLRPGRVVSRYRIEASLGSGGFATVFRARDIGLDRVVALKVFRPGSRQTVTAMLEEARLAAALTHPNVCAVYAVDDSEGVPLIAMEHLEGQTMSRLLYDKRLGPADAVRVLGGIAAGLAAAHERHVVHGDLKPGNVIVTREGHAKIVDFGLARRASPTELGHTHESRTSGTPRYMAPERFRGHPVTGASDVFAFGLMAYEAFAQRPALPGSTVQDLVRQILSLDGPRLAAELPPPFDDLVRRSLALAPEARTITMREIADAINDRR